jgi:ribosomal protein S18 acetylase RimI-like enzyme
MDALKTFLLNMDCQIRSGRAEDLILLVETWNPGSRHGHLENLRRCFRTVKKGARDVVVAEVNGFPVGQLWVVYQHTDPVLQDGSQMDSSLADGSRVAYLHTFDVFKYFRGLGIGRELFKETVERARYRGFQALTIGVEPQNAIALEMYRRWGFQDYKTGILYGNRILYLRKFL